METPARVRSSMGTMVTIIKWFPEFQCEDDIMSLGGAMVQSPSSLIRGGRYWTLLKPMPQYRDSNHVGHGSCTSGSTYVRRIANPSHGRYRIMRIILNHKEAPAGRQEARVTRKGERDPQYHSLSCSQLFPMISPLLH